MRSFFLSYLVTALALALSYLWAGGEGLLVCLLLIAMEVSFSFDNAVVNAGILKHMDAAWQRRFLTWGMLVATFGMYYLFPLAVVSLATGLGLADIMRLALRDPVAYRHHLMAAHTQIVAFGGMFLLMVFLTFLLDETKERHWLGRMEQKLSRLGKLEAVETIVALVLLLALQAFLPQQERLAAVISGAAGVVLYVSLNSVVALFGVKRGAAAAGYSALTAFLYLNLLDASFSLDAVVGSFAISSDIVIIMLGLSAGAMFVRSMTLHLVHKGTLDRYVYLEHGAHYAIGALAVIMLIDIVTPVPEVMTGMIGLAFILAAFWSSVLYNRRRGG